MTTTFVFYLIALAALVAFWGWNIWDYRRINKAKLFASLAGLLFLASLPAHAESGGSDRSRTSGGASAGDNASDPGNEVGTATGRSIGVSASGSIGAGAGG